MKTAHHTNTWTERTAKGVHEPGADDTDRPFNPQAFHQAHTSLGVAGHIVHMAGVFVPVVIGELIADPLKYKKAVRLASVGTALAYEVLYTVREAKRRDAQEAKLTACSSRE
jgi:hypothetical protein